MTVRIAILGLGEAGSAFATDLVASGASVIGYDPRALAVPGVAVAGTAAAACAEADLVLSLNSATAAEAVAAEVMPALRDGAVFADLNTGSPASKTRIGALAEACDVRFAEVVLMAPVPGRGAAVPSLAAGPGAAVYAEVMNGYGGRVELVDGPIGTATTRKLLRSIVMKGLAAAILEELEAGRRAGCEEWVRDDLCRQFGADLVTRLETGTHQHAARRVAEMDAVCELLDELKVRPLIADATRQRLAALAASGGREDGGGPAVT